MFIVIFTRYDNVGNHAVFINSAHKTEAAAKAALKQEYERVIEEMGFDPAWSNLQDNTFVCQNERMEDTVRCFVLDTAHKVGFQENDHTDYQLAVLTQAGADVEDYFERKVFG